MKLSICLLSILMVACTQEVQQAQPKPKPLSFDQFEISFRGGGYSGFNLRADSNRIFFAPPSLWGSWNDSFQYGILPDSILLAINATVMAIRADTTIRSTTMGCDDCSLVAVRAISGKDSIRIFQEGEIHPSIRKLVHVLDFFIDSLPHKKMNGIILMETARDLAPPPPPVVS